MRTQATSTTTRHKTVEIDGLDIFYREGGDETDRAVLLLHGFPTSSFMFRNLIPALADEFHLVAPDYPSYGQSSFPAKDEFDYTFERFYEIVMRFVDTVGLNTFSIYVQDYGAPIGLRIASRHPERVQALIVQNGNAYMDGFTPMWEPLFAYAGDRNDETEAPVRGLLTPEAIKWLWTHGTRDPKSIAPETWTLDAHNMDRRDNRDIQLDIFYDYRLNIPEYEKFQHYLREHQPPTLITWAQVTSSSGRRGPRPTRAICPTPRSTCWLPDTSRWKRNSSSLRTRCGASSTKTSAMPRATLDVSRPRAR